MNRALAFVIFCTIGVTCAQADDEIVVTAERRIQGTDTLASNIATIDNNEITSLGADHVSEILNRAPGVLIHRGSGQEHLTAIRSPVLTGGAGAGSFLFLENGVPLRAAGFANVNGLFEAQTALLDRVEIVRGPGGAFYGANAIHGVVNVITPAPADNFQSAAVSASGFHNKVTAAVARQNRGQGIYAGFSAHEDTGFRADSGTDQQGAIVRFAGTTDGWAHDTIITATNLNQETAGFIAGPDAYRDRRLSQTNPNPEAYRDSTALRLQSQWTKALQGGEFRLTPYARWTEMEFLQHFLPSKAVEENGHWSAGFQSAFYADDHFSFGLDGEYTEGYLTEIQTLPTVFSFVQGVHYDYDITAGSLSAFFKVDRNLSEALTLTLAARADWTTYEYKNNTSDGPFGRFIRPADRNDDFLTFSPKISLLHQAGNGQYWLSYAEGARPPQTTDLYRLQGNQDVTGVDPEHIRSLEAGWRGDMSDTVGGEVTVYYAKKENFLFRDADGFNVIDGKTQHIGIEADLNIAINDKLSLNANGSYAAHTYRFDRPVNSTANASEAISNGDDIDTAPRTLAGARLIWRPSGKSFAQAEWVHVGDYFTDASNNHDYPGHDVFNLRLEKSAGFFTAFAAVRNVFDTRYATRADFAFGTERYFPDAGRTLTLGLRYRN